MFRLLVDVLLGLPTPVLVVLSLMFIFVTFVPPTSCELSPSSSTEDLPSHNRSPPPPSQTSQLQSPPLFDPYYSMTSSSSLELKPLFTTAPLEPPSRSAQRQKQWWPYKRQQRPFRIRLGSVEEEAGYVCQ